MCFYDNMESGSKDHVIKSLTKEINSNFIGLIRSIRYKYL